MTVCVTRYNFISCLCQIFLFNCHLQCPNKAFLNLSWFEIKCTLFHCFLCPVFKKCLQQTAWNNEKPIWKLFQSHFCIELSLHIMELNPTRTCYFTEKIWFQWLGEEADFIWSTLAVLPSQRTLTMSHLASLHWEMSLWLSLMAKDMFLIGNKNIL